MQREIEVKVLNIDVEEMEEKLLSLGAKKISEEEQTNYTFIPEEGEFADGYLRIRESKFEDGKKIIELTFKEFKNSQNIFGDLESSDRESIETIGLIATLSYDMYIRKRLIEKLIDSLPSSKGDTGKDKK